MKPRLLVCMLFTTIFCNAAWAQDTQPIPRMEAMLGVGVYPLISAISAYDNTSPGLIDWNGYNYYSKKAIHSPSVNLTFSYRFKRWFALSGVVGWSMLSERYYDMYTNKKHATETQQRFTVMPVARFYWFNTRTVSLYSSLGVGLTYSMLNNFRGITQCSASKMLFAVHFASIGIIAGRRLFGYAELSAGMLGIVHAGIGYRF